MFIVALLIFRSLRITQKQKKIIESQKKEVDEQNIIIQQQKKIVEEQKALVELKNKDITDSITYGERIQSSLLIGEQFLPEFSKEYFLLFLPRDIVSGDFHWGCETDEYIFLAICDSTGHGVPGAMMSIMNISLLNEAIKEEKIYNPAEVFDYVRQRLIETVSRHGQKDGFDGILLRKNKRTGELHYAAANNHPILLSNSPSPLPNGEVRQRTDSPWRGAGVGHLQKLPADKMAVGYGERKTPFTLYEVPSPKFQISNSKKQPLELGTWDLGLGTCLYLFSDGFQDQFGGEKNKKFKSEKLRELLLSVQDKSMSEQKEIIEKTFLEWKGSIQQTDDMLMVGMRL
jgi:serine phosphatase RsbU (regulator of sigma subunit)